MSIDLNYLRQEIEKLAPTVWSSMVGVTLQAAPTVKTSLPSGHAWGGCVRIQGGWNGAVVLHCGVELLRLASKAMLGVSPEAATRDDLRDSLGELTNITGGNIKAILPGPSTLSLPMVAEGDELSVRVPKSHPILRLAFASLEGQLLIVLHESEKS